MLNKKQIQLVQMARKGAGLQEGRYRILLRQYTQPNGQSVTSCKQLTRDQVTDFLAVCESLGWRHPNQKPDHYRNTKRWYSNEMTSGVSVALAETIKLLAGDLGMTAENLKTFVRRMTSQRTDSLLMCSSVDGWKITEALKAMLSRRDGVNYETVADVAAAYSEPRRDTKGHESLGNHIAARR